MLVNSDKALAKGIIVLTDSVEVLTYSVLVLISSDLWCNSAD